MRPCGDCKECCDGNLIGEAYGHQFGNKTPCHYLIDDKCSIYSDRPSCCQQYFCLWAQAIIPENMRPDKSKMLVSVEIDDAGKKFLKVVLIEPVVDYAHYRAINNFCEENDTYYVVVK
jgi:hypothetical protein